MFASVRRVLVYLLPILAAVGLVMAWWKSRPQPETGPDIKTLITEVERQLSQLDLERRTSGRAALLSMQTFDLEVSFVAKASLKAGAEPKLLAVTSEGEFGSEKTHKVTLHMKTRSPTPGEILPKELETYIQGSTTPP